MVKKSIYILLSLFCLNTHAECDFVAWPYQKGTLEISKVSREIKVENLHKYFVYEITKGGNKKLAQNLYHQVLLNDERVDYIGFAKLLAYSSNLNSGTFKKLEKKKVCEIYQKIEN